MYKNNDIPVKQNEQEKANINQAFINRAFRRSDPDVQKVIIYFSNQSRDTKRRMYYFLLRLSVLHRNVFPRQSVIGDFADITREHANRVLKEMAHDGLLTIHNRGYNTCVYKLPENILSRASLKNLSGLFSWLKALPIFLLCTIKSTNVTPMSLTAKNIYKLSNTVIERGSPADVFRGDFLQKSRMQRIRMNVTPIIRDVAIKLGLSDYGKLLFTCFEDDIIKEVYLSHKDKENIKDPMRWIWSECRRISKERNMHPNYDLMKALIDEAGYTPSSGIYLSDDESQPDYGRKEYPQVERTISPASVAASSNKFLEMFPVPPVIREYESTGFTEYKKKHPY